MESSNTNPNWDCVIVGGGATGASAAVLLGRARRRTLVVDAGPVAATAPSGACSVAGSSEEGGDWGGSGASLGQLGEFPTVTVRSGRVERAERLDTGFAATLDNGERVTARRILIASGIDVVAPDIPGALELWGRGTLFHCPFQNGWEMRDRRWAATGVSDVGMVRALAARGWSDDVVLLSDGPAELSAESAARLDAAGVQVCEGEITGLTGSDGKLKAITFADGSALERDAMLVAPDFGQRWDGADELGLELTEMGALTVDAIGRTNVDGVFAAGDAAAGPQYVNGSHAAVFVHISLVAEEYELPYLMPAPAPVAIR